MASQPARLPDRSEAEFRKTLEERKVVCFCCAPFSEEHEPMSMECCRQCRELLFQEEDNKDEEEDQEEDEEEDEEEAESYTKSEANAIFWDTNGARLWNEIYHTPDLFTYMWTEVQADSETICNSSDRTSQWEQILRIAWRVVANVNGVSYNRPWVLQSLLVLDDALGPGNLLSDEQIEAYMAAGPLLDYAYLMLRCAEKMTSHERAQLDADLFRKIIGNSGGIWSLWFDRLEIRDGFPWDHIFGNAVYLCDDAHVLH
ncbi:hypothetical protein PMIN01_01127 [Paraphaeosphaeria minitans]|uniref:Uncharacterized protein n=1 Tax=Paraphaeosphaeria minitans TaxID=565426 RepID=A0A9P6GU52_9PLEO|nr:hypothetical protein PMIN01_01127 [Paraphaeosphaeria minitans]